MPWFFFFMYTQGGLVVKDLLYGGGEGDSDRDSVVERVREGISVRSLFVRLPDEVALHSAYTRVSWETLLWARYRRRERRKGKTTHAVDVSARTGLVCSPRQVAPPFESALVSPLFSLERRRGRLTARVLGEEVDDLAGLLPRLGETCTRESRTSVSGLSLVASWLPARDSRPRGTSADWFLRSSGSMCIVCCCGRASQVSFFCF